MVKSLLLILLFILVGGGIYYYGAIPALDKPLVRPENKIDIKPASTPSQLSSKLSSSLATPPQQKTLENNYHIFQSFNNCGPAAFSMALSYYGISRSQQQLGQELRPYQVPFGNNDDKSVTLSELAEKAPEYNLTAYHRPNGNMDQIKLFITYDIPVITRTWLKEDDDIGHYRIIKGFNDQTGQLIQDDSLQGKNLKYSYEDFNKLWEKFNFEYLVLVTDDKKEIAQKIIGEDIDYKKAWQKAVTLSQNKLSQNPDDVDSRFNLSVAYYNIGEYQKSVDEYEKVASRLSFRTLWYQIEPILSYYELGDYNQVFSITDRVLNNQNRAYSEAYMVRGNSYLKLGQKTQARIEFAKAVLYNRNFANKIPQID